MGVDGMNSADIFDEYFDDKKPKYVIKNCPACRVAPSCCTEWNLLHGEWKECENINDCVMKKIVQVCNEYSDKWEDCDFSNGLSGEIFKLLDIEECE